MLDSHALVFGARARALAPRRRTVAQFDSSVQKWTRNSQLTLGSDPLSNGPRKQAPSFLLDFSVYGFSPFAQPAWAVNRRHLAACLAMGRGRPSEAIYPTFMKAIPRWQPPPRPAVYRADALTRARWQSDEL